MPIALDPAAGAAPTPGVLPALETIAVKIRRDVYVVPGAVIVLLPAAAFVTLVNIAIPAGINIAVFIGNTTPAAFRGTITEGALVAIPVVRGLCPPVVAPDGACAPIGIGIRALIRHSAPAS